MDDYLKPRLESSVSWTSLPEEFHQQICDIFNETFSGSFVVESQIYPKEILLRIGHIKEDRIAQKNFEASMEYNGETEDVKTCIYLAVDLIGSLMEEYLKPRGIEEDFDFSTTWQEYMADEKIIFMKTSNVNTQLEKEANLLLGASAHEGLFQETSDKEKTDALEQECLVKN